MFRLCSAKFIANSAARIETGTAAVTIRVAPAERRNSASTSTASTTPAPAASWRSSRASVTSFASSAISRTSTPGRSSPRSSRASRTSADTATVFAPASLYTATPTPSTPSTSTRWSISASTSSTLPRSATRTALRPPRVVRQVAHDHVGDILGAAVAGYPAHLEDLVAFLQGAGFDIHVLVAQAGAELVQRHAEGIETVAVDRDPDLEFATSGDARLGNPGELLQRRRDLPPGQLAKLGEVGLAGGRDQAQRENRRLAGIEAPDQDLVHLGVPLDPPNRLLHIDEGEIEVGVPVERHRGDQAAGARHLEDLAAAAHRGELAFPRSGRRGAPSPSAGGCRSARRPPPWDSVGRAAGPPAVRATTGHRRGRRPRP